MGVLAGVTPLAQTGKLVVSTVTDDTQGNAVGTTLTCKFVLHEPPPFLFPLAKARSEGRA